MWFVLYFILALPVLVVAYLELSTFRRKKVLIKFKGPSGLPLVGNAHQMGKNPTGGFFLNTRREKRRGYTRNYPSRIAL